MFGQRSWAQGVALGDGAEQDQDLDLMIHVGPFHISIFCDSAALF